MSSVFIDGAVDIKDNGGKTIDVRQWVSVNPGGTYRRQLRPERNYIRTN